MISLTDLPDTCAMHSQTPFIGFTGTPIEVDDRNTQAVFADYVSVYDMKRAQADGAVVPIHFESRIALLNLDDDAMATIDEDFEEVTEGEEIPDERETQDKMGHT